LRKSFAIFWRRNLGFFRLAVITNLEYRVNYLTDAVLQPALATLIEITLWIAVFRSAGRAEIGGFTQEYYLAYVLWAAFLGRITTTWMYEYRMIEEIELGTVNSLLARPVSFFEYYLSQFMGYKLVTSAISLVFPLAVSLYFLLPTDFSRLPGALALVFYYLFFVHTLSFCIACLAFRLNKVTSFTVAKNLGLWLFSGELFPLDLLPEPWKGIFISLPFANAVYIPVGYLTGRADHSLLLQGFASATVGIAVAGLVAYGLWRSGLRRYSGTGA
jgi:ABC-2 type transport system permease protein